MTRRLKALAPLILFASLDACAGKAQRDAPSTGDAAGASSSSAGSSTVGATAGVAGSAEHGAAGSSGSGGSTPTTCLQPVAPTGTSSCDFNSYAFDPDSGYCAYFEKSNCAVTSNRFDTLAACVAACDKAGLLHCQVAGDCVVQNLACCGGCEPVKSQDLLALSRNYADTNTCPAATCSPCPPYDGEPERPYFGAKCSNHQCELFDVRKTELASCEGDADCLLREGLECCECASAGPWVSINTQQLLAANFLGCAPGGCPKCEGHAPSAGLRASCVGGRCAVVSSKP